MTQRRIITIVGARPQFIKAAAVSRAIARHNNASPPVLIVERILHTGQHYDHNMSQVFFDELDVPRPHFNLGIGSATHGVQTGRMLQAIEQVLLDEGPDWCLVYGDTNSTLAGALAAAKLHIPVAHVEAGLRSFNRRMPEEINRVLTDHCSDLLFCPTDAAVQNLAREGITGGVRRVGDVMYDCALYYAARADGAAAALLAGLGIEPKSYYLATVHRAENTDDPNRLRSILLAFAALASVKCPVVFPAHPRTRQKLADLDCTLSAHVKIVQPVTYLQMMGLEKNARAILTDSGGVQKEAYFHRVPCITLRDETEWVETVEAGWNRLAGADTDAIVSAAAACADAEPEWLPLYGDGAAAEQIIRELLAASRKPPLEAEDCK